MKSSVSFNTSNITSVVICLICMGCFPASSVLAQTIEFKKGMVSKPISDNLFGLFFEDINYAADGGLYAELIQNRSFEYNPIEKREWHALSFWDYLTPGFSYGKISVESREPVHVNNPHYVELTAEFTGQEGVGMRNKGFSPIGVKSGETYRFSMFTRLLSEEPVTMKVALLDNLGRMLAWKEVQISNTGWHQIESNLTTIRDCDSTSLVLLAVTKGKIALDMVSLFPEATFKGRKNGLRTDLAQLLADIKPAFIRFPGGCLVHGDGVGNMYRWKNTVGPLEQRVEQKNLWGYHQSMGLGYFEYFQLCEDIGAKPVPVLPAAVSCQNSGGTWRTGGTGQQALPLEDMEEYLQEVLDLVEWANGPADSKWGRIRAEAGHPEPFGLKYIGIGNEDKITPEFQSRFKMIYEAVKSAHSEITIIGTSGPFSDGEDFEKGWEIASTLEIPVVDEHYYKDPEWFTSNLKRYDAYDRSKPKVYLGEYASWGNKLSNALAEAAYMIGLERNGDVVEMASYAPLFAKKDFTQWRTDMIFFDHKTAFLTPNYHVQKMFSLHKGQKYISNIVTPTTSDSALSASCVLDENQGDLIFKMVNTGDASGDFTIDLSKVKGYDATANLEILTGAPGDENSFESPEKVAPKVSKMNIARKFVYSSPPTSFSVIRIKAIKK